MRVNVIRRREPKIQITAAISQDDARRLERICLKNRWCVADATRAALALAFEKYDSEHAA
jgi:hypothetical protein